MGKKLAIKSHPTRGEEVIELLETIGGKNIHNLSGDDSCAYYVIEGWQNEIRAGEYIFGDEDMYFFTLEEFLEKYPFKVGDKVMDMEGDGDLLTIKSMSWSDDCESMVYDFKDSVVVLAAEDLTKPRHHLKNVLSELYEHIKTTPKEDLEKEFKEIEEWSHVGPTVEEFMDFCDKVNKKSKYPKTYAECCELLSLGEDGRLYTKGYKASLIQNFHKLYICRDAYWKIAGEEMGLGKPWEPDWNDEIQKYCIRTDRNKIVNCSSSFNNRILAFPTVEMRDAFYENFKDLIEQCKELL